MNCIYFNLLTTKRAKKILFLFILFLGISFYTKAQTEFAPIGSKWHYGYYKDRENIVPEEYFTYESVKDTLIEGKTCKKLDIWYFNKDNKATYWGFDILFSDSGRVFYYYKNKFNLLYDFNLNVGDSINILLYNPNIPGIKNLPDTHYVKYKIRNKGNVTINNKNIRFYDIRLPLTYDSLISNKMQLIFSGRIYEKIGDSSFLYGWLIPEGYYHFHSYLRCYSDNDFQYHLKINLPCDTIITVIDEDLTEKSNITLYPNPVYQKLYIKLNSSEININTNFRIIDILGREYEFKLEKINDLVFSIDIGELEAGTYFLIMLNTNQIYNKLIKL